MTFNTLEAATKDAIEISRDCLGWWSVYQIGASEFLVIRGRLTSLPGLLIAVYSGGKAVVNNRRTA